MISSSADARRENWKAALAARYPLARSVGFECFGGWQPILARLLERLEAMVAELPADTRQDFRIEQIKQKFGRLLVYLAKEGTVEMQAAIEEAGDASVVTCEVCSAPGQLADRNGWISVRCPKHETWSRLDGGM
jgi:hypothetical protein